MLTPEDLHDLVLEQAEKPYSYITIKREQAASKTPEKSSNLISEDVHNTSMEVVQNIRRGIIND